MLSQSFLTMACLLLAYLIISFQIWWTINLLWFSYTILIQSFWEWCRLSKQLGLMNLDFCWTHSKVRIWHHLPESMDPGWWRWLCPLKPTNNQLNATGYLSIVSDHVNFFMATIFTHILIATFQIIMYPIIIGFMHRKMSSVFF